MAVPHEHLGFKMGMFAIDAIPGKHAKSAEVFEKKEDIFRSSAKERERADKE